MGLLSSKTLARSVPAGHSPADPVWGTLAGLIIGPVIRYWSTPAFMQGRVQPLPVPVGDPGQLFRCRAGWRRLGDGLQRASGVGGEPGDGVDRGGAAGHDLEVQVCAGARSGVADEADELPDGDGVAWS